MWWARTFELAFKLTEQSFSLRLQGRNRTCVWYNIAEMVKYWRWTHTCTFFSVEGWIWVGYREGRNLICCLQFYLPECTGPYFMYFVLFLQTLITLIFIIYLSHLSLICHSYLCVLSFIHVCTYVWHLSIMCLYICTCNSFTYIHTWMDLCICVWNLYIQPDINQELYSEKSCYVCTEYLQSSFPVTIP